MITEAHSFLPSIQFPVKASVTYHEGGSIKSLFDLRDRAFKLLQESSYESKEQLLPLVKLSQERSRSSSDASLLYGRFLLVSGFDSSYFLRVIHTQTANGRLFMRMLEEVPSEDNAKALLAWASCLDSAVKRYAQICLVSRPLKETRTAEDGRWTVRMSLPAIELPLCG